MAEKKYDFRYDIVRAVAIIMVVGIHSSELLCNSAISEVGCGMNSIFYTPLQLIFTAVPIFVMLSGALLLGREEPLGLFFKKRLSRVLIPFFIWSIVVFALLYVQDGGRTFGGYIEGLTTKTLFGQGAHSIYWYIYIIIGLYLFTPALRVFYARADKQLAYYTLILLICMFVVSKTLPDFTLVKRFVCPNLEYLMYFIGGYTIVKYVRFESWFKNVSIAVLLVGWLMMGLRFTITNTFADHLEISRLLACLGLFSVFFIKENINLEKIANPTRNILMGGAKLLSSYSYGIYLTHFMFISLFLKFGFMHSIPTYIEIFLMVSLVLVVDVLMLWVLKMMKLGKWVM